MFERDNKINDDLMLNKLYNMIKTSLSLNNVENKKELLINFEKVTKDIDKSEHSTYLKEVNEKFYKTTNLDDERKRLSGLIVLINERIEQRNKLLNDYYEVTGQNLFGLDDINYATDLNSFKQRWSVICSYLENEEEISNIKKELEFLSNQLEKEREVKRNCEVVNAKLEEKLLSNFKNVIAGNKYYTSLSFKDIDDEIKKNELELKEKEEKVNAFVLAYDSIKNESITSNDQLEEYSSYVVQMKEMYYDCTKKNAFLQIYKLVMNPKVSTDEIYHKRILIKKILDDLTTVKIKLKIEEPNLLFDFYMLVKEQDVKVINSVDNMKKIKQIEDKIDYFNDKIQALENEQGNDKIISILKEYGLITEKSYDNSFTNSNEINSFGEKDNNQFGNEYEFKIPDLEQTNTPLEVKLINYLDNTIKEVKDISPNMNVGLVTKKANNVINKVSDRLGIVKEKPIVNIVAESISDTPIEQRTEQNIIESFAINNEKNVENNSNVETSKPVVMPDFDFTTFWDDVTLNSDNSNNGNNMPNLPV